MFKFKKVRKIRFRKSRTIAIFVKLRKQNSLKESIISKVRMIKAIKNKKEDM